MDIFGAIKNVSESVGSSVKEHSPELCLGFGIAAMVGATIFACKGTIKAKKAVEDCKDDLKTIEKSEERGVALDENNNEIEYTHQDSINDKAIVFAKTGMVVVKAYGPAIILTAAGIACLVSGHHILRKRNLALAAAYNAISEAYKRYQDKVKDALGETVARNLKYGLTEKEVDVDTGKKNKDGTPKTKKEKKPVFDDMTTINEMSPYARFWDESCTDFTKDPIYDLAFLKSKQNWWNDVLRIKRRVTLNEIYRDLGMKETMEGCRVGWCLDNPKSDGYIDFGIFNMAYTPNRDFVNGYEPVCLLDFNVDGAIDKYYPKNKEVQNGSV